MQHIGILGAGGMAREAAAYAACTVDFFAVNSKYLSAADTSKLIDVTTTEEDRTVVPVVSALGAPVGRKAMLEAWHGSSYATVIAKSAEVFSDMIGEGAIIASKAIVTTGVTIGKHTIINIGATVSHDCQLGDFVTVSPGAHIAGNVKLGDGVFIGIGATVSNGVQLAPGVVVGAGATVIRDVTEENSVVAGVPAKIIGRNEGWLREI